MSEEEEEEKKTPEEELEEVQKEVEKLTQRLLSRYKKTIKGSRAILADIRNIDMKKLGQFDVIVMDPPWNLGKGSRGVNLPYQTLSIKDIQSMDIPALQTTGFLFMWTINAHMITALDMAKRWGYE